METSLTLRHPATPMLPPALSAAAEARHADELPVGKLPIPEVGKLFNRLLSRAALLLGHKSWQNDDELFTLAAACAEMAQHRFAGFKPSEIDLAMRRGGTGEYRRTPDEVVYVGLQTVADWLSAYQAKARAAVIQLEQRAAGAEPPRLPEAHPDRVKWRVDKLTELVEQAGASQLPNECDPGNCLYDWLKAIGVFRGFRTPEEYEAIRAEEAEQILARPLPAARKDRAELKSFADALELQRWPADHPLALTVASACKKRVLREWLADMALEQADVRALLEQAATVHYDSHPEAA